MITNELRAKHFLNYFYGAFALMHIWGSVKTYMAYQFASTAVNVLVFWMLVGMITYILALFVNNKGFKNLAILLFILEQSVHQFVLVKYHGINLGFQSYHFIGPVLIFLTSYRLSVKISIICLLFISYCFLILYGLNNVPLLNLNVDFIREAHLTNAVILFMTFSLIAYVYQASVESAEKNYENEQIKTNKLLHNILPAEIVSRLKAKPGKIADKYSEASVLFADLVGFTELSSSMSPSRLVDIIDDIFGKFDLIVDNLGLEKIKTIGDAYMIVGGVPIENNNHAELISNAALEMQRAIKSFNKEKNENLNIRIGIHTGPLIAGVIGNKKLTYDIWGDTVNIASRMESHSENGKIQISETTYNLIKGKFLTEERGKIDIKGKGEMRTFYLLNSN
jgi:class 3 adenylate cyclase